MRIPSRSASVLCLALASAPLAAEELYIRGLGEIFSAGICSIGPGTCISFLSVEHAVADFCRRRPSAINVAGHSLGASAAIRFVHGAAACGLHVNAAAFLDPMTHPYAIPGGTRQLVLFSPAFAGAGDGHPDATFVGGSHVGMTFRPDVRARVRSFFDRPSIMRKQGVR